MQNTTNCDIYDADTQQYPVVNRHSTVPPIELFIKPSKPYCKHRHTVTISMLQCLYAAIAILIGGVVYYWLASQPVYRIVALVVIGILWSNAASITARRKSIDMLETIEHPALKVWSQRQKKQRKAVYMENTNVFLKAVRSSIVER